MFQVAYTKKVQKQIKKLDRSVQYLLLSWIDKNLEGTDSPRQLGKPLTANRTNQWRYRIGHYRLLCDIQDDKAIILALEVGHSSKFYKNN
ncbi:RelE-domain-containing protein [Staphylococcus microti]|nr:type II toxin-antitoxin system RelE/ParE family toxin [Staphylococcus microti]KIX90455.1 RelE-domain-containing protein [Staphylococcus microti]PNZ80702.1 type II toxin-antitoxin system RelE/ParE family toxin [Staphylococcus microti]